MMVQVPLADPLRFFADEAAAIRSAVDQVLAGGSLVLGPRVEAFEEAFAAYLAPGGPAPAVVGVGSGTDALVIALLALDLPLGSAVLVPANDGGFSATAARGAGLVPVPVDADPVTQLVDLARLEAATGPLVRAAVVTHLHGQTVDLGPILAWCRQHGLLLVEDAAQAHGATLGDRRTGTLADAAAFSFYPTKNLGALGDGGAVVTADAQVAARARRLRQYGWDERFRTAVPHGRNSRLDALQASVLSARLPFLDDGNLRRRAIVGRYRAALGDSDAVVLGDAPGAVAHHAVVVHPDRDRLAAALARHDVVTAVHYPWLVTEMPGLGLEPVALPGADRGRRCTLSLPCFPTLTHAEIDRVSAALQEWGGGRG
jgi:dTDP-4-amino-4,6-dideoxygalactose transaminase